MMSPELTRDPSSNVWAVWFTRAMWLGIVQDFVMGVPALLWPAWILSSLGQIVPSPEGLTWVRFAAVALLVLGAMYIPAAVNPYRYPLVAWLSVLARPPGVIFFFWLYPNTYPLFGIIDSFLVLVQGSLLLATFYAPVRAPSFRYDRLAADDSKAQPDGDYHGTSFHQLKRVVWSDPYDTLPYHVGLGPIKLLRFFNDSSRNLSDKRDLMPYFDKLIHSNGICFTGTWEITETSPYTGYFAKGSKGLLLVRASVAGLSLTANTRRAFGLGGKLFPTMNPDETAYPANFVVVSHLSGIRTRHITDIEMTNRPTVGLGVAPNIVNRVIFRMLDTRPGFRQVHSI
ncbi:MAG: hypothetical protein IT423_17555, partial [Pirellulaceae bacterium]|nr:hypothetical protein [Pirellulaceae bacterium]